MMIQAFYTGLSGVKNNSLGIDAVSDNLANINSVGYRGYEIEFSSLFEKSVASANRGSSVNSSIGIGSQAYSSPTGQQNGTLLLTDRSTDIAIDGDGWFGIQGVNGTQYTRAGNFTFDINNDLVTPDGYYVLGTMGNNIQGNTLTSVFDSLPLGDLNTQAKLQFPDTLTVPPQPTTMSSFYGNLGISDATRVISSAVVDGANNRNALELQFTKSINQNVLGTRWDVAATTKSLDGNTTYDMQNGVVEFDERGAIVSNTLTSIGNNGTQIAINLGSEFDGIISTDVPFTSGSSASNGSIGGDLVGYSISQNAEVIATFSNGMQSSVGKVALYHFQNDQGLERISGSRFQESTNSGRAMFYQDANGQNILGANVIPFTLENSNYSTATGLTELIILQRSYDANAKSITTADQMMQKALSMDA
ncbi:MAG: flagellar hook-basal body complex protein [Candidatus Margulisbacteria bacterium]|nr:flagellar hook-basal body complex protein [Candidatus Margulisiibacteriota bacterium]